MALGQLRGDVATLRLALRAIDALDFTEEERAEIGLHGDNGQMAWNDAGAARAWDISLDKREAAFVARVAQDYRQWPVAKVKEVLDLFEQLGIEMPE